MVPWGIILVAPEPTDNIDGTTIWMIFEAPGLPNSILQMLKRTEYSITVVLEARGLTRRWGRRIFGLGERLPLTSGANPSCLPQGRHQGALASRDATTRHAMPRDVETK